MSIKVMTAVWDGSPEKGEGLLVLLALADFANDRGECWPSVETIAHKARCSIRGVQGIIARLQETGQLTVSRNKGPNGVNRYTLTYAPPHPAHPIDDEVSEKQARYPAPGAPPHRVHPAVGGQPNAPSPPQLVGSQMHPEPSGTVIENRQEPSMAKLKTSRPKQTWGHHVDAEAFVRSMLPELADVMTEDQVRGELEQCLGYKTTKNYVRLDLVAAKWLRKNAQDERDRRARNNGQYRGGVASGGGNHPRGGNRVDVEATHGFAGLV